MRFLRSSWSKPPLKVLAGFAVAVVTLLLVWGATMHALSTRTLNSLLVERTVDVLMTTEELLNNVNDSELAITEFLITNNPDLLATYQTTRQSIPTRVGELRRLTADTPHMQRRVDELEPVLMAELEHYARELEARGAGASIESLRSSLIEGRQLLERSKRLLDALKADTTTRLSAEEKALAGSRRTTLLVVVLGDFVLLALILSAAIISLRDSAERARAVEFQRRILGIVGHDLRNPLTVVAMSAAQIARGADARSQTAAHRIVAAAHRMEKLIRDVLDYSRLELDVSLPVDIRPCNVDESCRRIIDEFRSVHPDRAIIYEPNDASSVAWDPDRIEQVLENLVANALKYSPPSTPVSLSWHRDDGEIVIAIENRGPPIPSEVLPHIFEPFRRGTAKEAGGASTSVGLGLYIADQIVAAHGGSIEVRSTPEATCFRVHLPQRPLPAPDVPS